jgi:GNAT superfamily N-acetyltransferase
MRKDSSGLLRTTQVRVITTPSGISVAVPPGFPIRKGDMIHEERGRVLATRPRSTINSSPRVVVPKATAQLFPYYRKVFDIEGGKKVVIRFVTDIQDILACRRLPHYLVWPPSGLYVAAEMDDVVVGALVLHRLPYHMRPSWRRELEDSWGGYREAIWVRRISVAQRVQRQGIGRALARAAKEIGRRYWLPQPQVVELISKEPTYPFLLECGYQRANEGRAGYLRMQTAAGVEIRREKRYYYWASIT